MQWKKQRLELGIYCDNTYFTALNLNKNLSSNQLIHSCLIMKHYFAKSSVKWNYAQYNLRTI
jgi:hypothetical protein